MDLTTKGMAPDDLARIPLPPAALPATTARRRTRLMSTFLSPDDSFFVELAKGSTSVASTFVTTGTTRVPKKPPKYCEDGNDDDLLLKAKKRRKSIHVQKMAKKIKIHDNRDLSEMQMKLVNPREIKEMPIETTPLLGQSKRDLEMVIYQEHPVVSTSDCDADSKAPLQTDGCIHSKRELEHAIDREHPMVAIVGPLWSATSPEDTELIQSHAIASDCDANATIKDSQSDVSKQSKRDLEQVIDNEQALVPIVVPETERYEWSPSPHQVTEPLITSDCDAETPDQDQNQDLEPVIVLENPVVPIVVPETERYERSPSPQVTVSYQSNEITSDCDAEAIGTVQTKVAMPNKPDIGQVIDQKHPMLPKRSVSTEDTKPFQSDFTNCFETMLKLKANVVEYFDSYKSTQDEIKCELKIELSKSIEKFRNDFNKSIDIFKNDIFQSVDSIMAKQRWPSELQTAPQQVIID